LLFLDLACLAMIGLWDMRSQGASERCGNTPLADVGDDGVEPTLPSGEPHTPIEDGSH
jgi:hypothetical protein